MSIFSSLAVWPKYRDITEIPEAGGGFSFHIDFDDYLFFVFSSCLEFVSVEYPAVMYCLLKLQGLNCSSSWPDTLTLFQIALPQHCSSVSQTSLSLLTLVFYVCIACSLDNLGIFFVGLWGILELIWVATGILSAALPVMILQLICIVVCDSNSTWLEPNGVCLVFFRITHEAISLNIRFPSCSRKWQNTEYDCQCRKGPSYYTTLLDEFKKIPLCGNKVTSHRLKFHGAFLAN